MNDYWQFTVWFLLASLLLGLQLTVGQPGECIEEAIPGEVDFASKVKMPKRRCDCN